MKLFLALLIGSLAAVAGAQADPTASKASSRAAIEGIVIKEPGSEPVKKVLIELIAENQSEGGDYTAVTAADGTFRIENIVPGRYHLFAERTGLLEVQKHHPAPQGRVVTLAAGQELKDLQIRLQASAVMRGRVTDEDGDPMEAAQVNVMRQTFTTGHSRWEQVQSERTNDLGEYRVANLPAGSYYVSVSPPPDFKAFVDTSGPAPAKSASGPNTPEKPETSYQPVYYPGTTDRSQAAPLQLNAGDDFPLDFSLTPSPSLSIRGSVVNLPAKATTTIMLQSRDFNMVLTATEMHKDGSFVIHDVAPGAYTILASVENSRVPMMARQSLQVVSSSVEGLRLAPQSGGTIRGRVRVESAGSRKVDVSQLFLMLHSSESDEDALAFFNITAFNPMARVNTDGSFEWMNVPPGNYYVQVSGDDGSGNADGGWFLKSTAVDGREIADGIVSVNSGTTSLDLVASANGAIVDGIVADKNGQPVANAVVVAVPEARYRGRVDRFRKTVTDQNGRFELRGTPPGDYTLFAWESLDSDAYYDPEFLRKYQPQAVAVRTAEGEHKTVPLQVISGSEDQP